MDLSWCNIWIARIGHLGSVPCPLEFDLIILLHIDLSSHAPCSAKEYNVRDAINDPCHVSQGLDTDGQGVANAGKALHAVIEANELVVRWLGLESILNHQL